MNAVLVATRSWYVIWLLEFRRMNRSVCAFSLWSNLGLFAHLVVLFCGTLVKHFLCLVLIYLCLKLKLGSQPLVLLLVLDFKLVGQLVVYKPRIMHMCNQLFLPWQTESLLQLRHLRLALYFPDRFYQSHSSGLPFIFDCRCISWTVESWQLGRWLRSCGFIIG